MKKKIKKTKVPDCMCVIHIRREKEASGIYASCLCPCHKKEEENDKRE
jgi:hypothetical protein